MWGRRIVQLSACVGAATNAQRQGRGCASYVFQVSLLSPEPTSRVSQANLTPKRFPASRLLGVIIPVQTTASSRGEEALGRIQKNGMASA